MNHLKIHIPKQSHFSVGTSPYYAHQNAVAIDIYHEICLNNFDVFSPISGKVIETKEMLAPKPRFKEGINKEYLTLIQNPHDINTVFKILHVKPYLNIGDEIEVGDTIGKTIKNGYFAPWSSPHLHLELKKPEEALRAKGGMNFSLKTKKNFRDAEEINDLEQIPVNVNYICKEFYLCQFPKDFYQYLDPIYGIGAKINNISCVIDGGIPIYRNGIVHFSNEVEDIKEFTSVRLNNVPVGRLTGINHKYGYIEFLNTKFLLNSKKIRGISLFLANFKPLVKIIPYSATDFDFNLDSTQFLTIEA
jgi:murein DD-endopeptidase MepM/ murein hydrolase activator NlpD